ncbi:MAG: hypothetical protein KKC18_12685, partial [Chloroflexi bacterium]|nr:hypothetical protein [Chloroflexota bacterium]
QLTVSHFRLGLLKRLVPTGLLVMLDRLCQPTGALWQLTPSVFVRCTADGDRPASQPGDFFRCTVCGSTVLMDEGGALSCTDCDARFAVRNGIYDLRSPLEGGVR